MKRYLVIACCATGVVLVLLVSDVGHKAARPVTYAQAKDALTMMKEWATWITGIQVGAIAAIGYFANPEMARRQKMVAFLSVLFFGGSIVLATWLLSGFPSVIQRLDPSGNAVLENNIFQCWLFGFIPIRVGLVSSLQHYLFALGAICFFVLVVLRFHGDQQKS